ncbi:TMEM175 family protein [Sphingomonas sp.]|uniref:TMEM175 family protein n=1 Tax=Sphingomonas sp. TaxID=28214 RepID=UPI003CC57F84
MTDAGRHDDDRHALAELERLTFFSDAVFAIAMTLLVVDVRLPALARPTNSALTDALLALVPQYIGFVVSFLVIGRFWAAHHVVFGMLRRADGRLVGVNLLFLLSIAFMPFPTMVLSEHPQLRGALVFYIAWLFVIALLNCWTTQTAFRRGTLVRRGVGAVTVANRLRHTLIPVVVALIACGASLIGAAYGLAALTIGTPVVEWAVRRLDRPGPPRPAAGLSPAPSARAASAAPG